MQLLNCFMSMILGGLVSAGTVLYLENKDCNDQKLPFCEIQESSTVDFVVKCGDYN